MAPKTDFDHYAAQGPAAKRRRISKSPATRAEEPQSEAEDCIICAPTEPDDWPSVDITENEQHQPNERLETQHSEKCISFEEVFQNGNAPVKTTIIQFPKGHGPWFILRCDQHGLNFRSHPLKGASAHLRSGKHGRLRYSSGIAVIQHFGVEVLGCNEELAETNNAAVTKADQSTLEPLAIRVNDNAKTRHLTPRKEKRRKLPSSNRSRESSAGGADDKTPSKLQNSDAILNPAPGWIYLAYWETVRAWYPALILPQSHDDFDDIGVPDTPEDLGLMERVPKCYIYDASTKGLKWKAGYEDGGPLVAKRKFPVLFFNGGKFPDRNTAAWVSARNLQAFNVFHATSGLVPHLKSAQNYVRRRLAAKERVSPAPSSDMTHEVLNKLPPPSSTAGSQSPAISTTEDIPILIDEPANEPAPEPTPEPTPEPVIEPATDQGVDSAIKPGSELLSKPESVTEPEPTTEPEPPPVLEPVLEPTIEPATEPVIEPTPEPVINPVSQATPEPAIEPVIVPAIESEEELEIESEDEPVTESASEPAIELPSPKRKSLTPSVQYDPTISTPRLESRGEGSRDYVPELSSASGTAQPSSPRARSHTADLENILNPEPETNENEPIIVADSPSKHSVEDETGQMHGEYPAIRSPEPTSSLTNAHSGSVKRALFNHMKADLYNLQIRSIGTSFPKAVYDPDTSQPHLPPPQPPNTRLPTPASVTSSPSFSFSSPVPAHPPVVHPPVAHPAASTDYMYGLLAPPGRKRGNNGRVRKRLPDTNDPRFGEMPYDVPTTVLNRVRKWLKTDERNPRVNAFRDNDGLYTCPWCRRRYARAGIFTDHLSSKHTSC
ncbi:hypothetical protein NM208_g30 [Fusarium decemcellulare]|uniref:Uncharacterized protein n=1 Tax=Fusarium decemcellulare TaxID=57161 RepID=A0ACC1T135_9HYPO|nr:hypothetical protein NM208_g30 [Fusarium decemcellulare]